MSFKTNVASLKRRKWGLGVPIRMKMIWILINTDYCTLLLLVSIGYYILIIALAIDPPFLGWWHGPSLCHQPGPEHVVYRMAWGRQARRYSRRHDMHLSPSLSLSLSIYIYVYIYVYIYIYSDGQIGCLGVANACCFCWFWQGGIHALMNHDCL